MLDCNGVCLQRADFAEAVYLLKNQRRLDLLIRKGAATGKYRVTHLLGKNLPLT